MSITDTRIHIYTSEKVQMNTIYLQTDRTSIKSDSNVLLIIELDYEFIDMVLELS